MKILNLIILFTALSCSRSETLTESERAEIIQATQQTLNNYYDDIRRDGLSAEFRYLDHSADFFWVPPGYSTPLSYDSVAAILNANASMFKSVDNSFDTLNIIPLSKELVTYTGRLRSIMTDTSGQASTFTLVETGILIKRKDGWKLLSGQTTIVDNKK